MVVPETDKVKTLKTKRYEIFYREIVKGGAGGYESTYLTQEGDKAPQELYDVLSGFQGRVLPVTNRKIRQRNGSTLVEALRTDRELGVGIASGFKPSGPCHFGHRLTSSAVTFFQKNGAQIFVPVADLECMLGKKISKEQYMYWAADNLLDWGSNGINLDAAHVYLQSEEHRVSNLAYLLARGLSFDFAVDTYSMEKLCGDPDKKGDKGEFPFLFAGITQVGDILLPQHEDFGNYHSFMVGGQDQDGHMKMTIALTEIALDSRIELPGIQTIPSAFYIPHIRGISGDKASSSKVAETLYLGSGPEREDLTERIKSTLRKFDNANEYHRRRCALDMVRFIDVFNRENTFDFVGIVDDKQYRELMDGRDSKKSNDKFLDMDESEQRIISWLFEEYKAGELSKAKTTEERLEREVEIEGNSIKTKNQFLSQHRFDEYLIQRCKECDQNNVDIVRDTLPTALREHQKKRESILEYAKARASYRPQGGWSLDDDKPVQPEFWKVPERSVVDESKRNPTQWFNIVDAVADKIIP